MLLRVVVEYQFTFDFVDKIYFIKCNFVIIEMSEHPPVQQNT